MRSPEDSGEGKGAHSFLGSVTIILWGCVACLFPVKKHGTTSTPPELQQMQNGEAEELPTLSSF